MSDSVTISLLPVSLSIVHIPRSRIHSLCHPLIRQLLLPKPTFLNLTCNEIELSIFAEHCYLSDFESVARKDARRLKVRGRVPHAKLDRPAKRSREDWEPIEFSAEKWNVLQIDSHSSTIDNSSARIHELSAPLAAAGISILYQSSYMSDFIFVKEYRLAEVMSLLASAGFDLYSSDPQHLTSQLSTLTSPVLSPLNGIDDNSSVHLLDLSSSASAIFPENGAVLTRSRSSTDASISQLQSAANTLLKTDADAETSAGDASEPPSTGRSQSHSPSGSDVRILDPHLTCIGLEDDRAHEWTTKIIKLVAYPDLITGTSLSSPLESKAHGSSHGIPVHDVHPSETQLDMSVESGSETDNSGSRSDNTTRVGVDSPKESPARFSSESPIFDLERHVDEDGSSEDGNKDGDDDRSSDDETSFFSAGTDDVPSSPLSLVAPAKATKKSRPTLPPLQTEATIVREVTRTSRKSRRRRSTSDDEESLMDSRPDSLVPFFSFTRTSEGSSLTASVPLLAALFPAEERDMVICSGELDIQDSRSVSPDGAQEEDESLEGGVRASGLPEPLGIMRCLQIDLRKFGLDKHGLVSRFSRTLEQNGINHMYSSTYKTANLLVDKAHASRAQALLRSC
ncbi:hypothetical protein K474DRAFT_1681303 [Panus rudis PR-1116 ss-1]|nr:hypothetical protein K474DRAFT_1681303 [Panus rudis PR-1116 ss-1]